MGKLELIDRHVFSSQSLMNVLQHVEIELG